MLGRFTLWPKLERPSISTNWIARNLEFSLSTLHIRGQSPKAIGTLNAYFLTKATDSQRKFGSDGNGNPNYG
jgi:hypothetical protein